jgi:hypothetical protein
VAGEVYKCEARLTALRARRQRWLAKVEALEGVRGAGAERGQARHQLRVVEAEFAAAETKLRAAQMRAAANENHEIALEECMVKDLDELRALATTCDTHARELGATLKELYAKLSELRQRNVGRGPSGMMLNLNLRQAAEQHFDGTVLRSRPFPSSRHRTFAQLIDGWAPTLSAPPSSPPPPSPRDERPLAGASLEGGPTLP